MRSKTKEENKEVEAKPDDNKREEGRREVVESLRTQLTIQAIPPEDDDIVTRVVEVTDSAVIALISFLQSS